MCAAQLSGTCARHCSYSRTYVFPVSFKSVCPLKRFKSKVAQSVCCITPSRAGGRCTDRSTLSSGRGIHHLFDDLLACITVKFPVLCGCSQRILVEACFFIYFLFKLNLQTFFIRPFFFSKLHFLSYHSVQSSWYIARIFTLLLLFILGFEDELQHVRNSHQHACTFQNISESGWGLIGRCGIALKVQSRARLLHSMYNL